MSTPLPARRDHDWVPRALSLRCALAAIRSYGGMLSHEAGEAAGHTGAMQILGDHQRGRLDSQGRKSERLGTRERDKRLADDGVSHSR
jgi:hypothetical protein